MAELIELGLPVQATEILCNDEVYHAGEVDELVSQLNERIIELEAALTQQYHYANLEMRDIEQIIPELKDQGE